MSYHFFAMLSRLKYINRWSLMRNTFPDNLSDHTTQVTFIAHALALISNKCLGNCLNAERAAVLALFHDTTEIITGDLPTPIKYYNPDMKDAYKKVEAVAANKLLSLLPDYLYEEYAPLYKPSEQDQTLLPLVKAADKLSALIKCIEEEKAGNSEFTKAKAATLDTLAAMALPEVDIFMRDFLPSYQLTLDELN